MNAEAINEYFTTLNQLRLNRTIREHEEVVRRDRPEHVAPDMHARRRAEARAEYNRQVEAQCEGPVECES